jgi:NAD dependent epimerase/dehydratase family/SPW repeat
VNEQVRDVVLVTGSSGLIGAAVARRLAEEFAVIGFDKDGNPYPPPQAECVCVDLTSDESVRAGFERVLHAYGRHIASVIHLAAYYDFSGEPSPLYEGITVRGTERLLRALQGYDVGQFVFSSTMLVHSPVEPGERIDKESPLDPKWDYPKSKVRTEELIREKRGKIPVALLRIAGVYDDRGHSIPLAHQMQRIYERRLTSHLEPSRERRPWDLTDVRSGRLRDCGGRCQQQPSGRRAHRHRGGDRDGGGHRAFRFFNVLAGLWVAASPWFLSNGTAVVRWNGMATGLAILFFSLPRGRVKEKYGRWDRLVV